MQSVLFRWLKRNRHGHGGLDDDGRGAHSVIVELLTFDGPDSGTFHVADTLVDVRKVATGPDFRVLRCTQVVQ